MCRFYSILFYSYSYSVSVCLYQGRADIDIAIAARHRQASASVSQYQEERREKGLVCGGWSIFLLLRYFLNNIIIVYFRFFPKDANSLVLSLSLSRVT